MLLFLLFLTYFMRRIFYVCHCWWYPKYFGRQLSFCFCLDDLPNKGTQQTPTNDINTNSKSLSFTNNVYDYESRKSKNIDLVTTILILVIVDQ